MEVEDGLQCNCMGNILDQVSGRVARLRDLVTWLPSERKHSKLNLFEFLFPNFILGPDFEFDQHIPNRVSVGSFNFSSVGVIAYPHSFNATPHRFLLDA